MLHAFAQSAHLAKYVAHLINAENIPTVRLFLQSHYLFLLLISYSCHTCISA